MGALGAPLSARAQARANEPQGPAAATGAAAPASAAGAPAGPEPGERVPPRRYGSGSVTIALLLPRQDGPFARAASSLLAGVLAAHAADGAGTVVEAIEIDDQADELALVMAELNDRRVDLVLGPITRNGATALLESGAAGLPTLALNLPDGNQPAPARLSFFGLAIEVEARQVASLAFEEAVARTGGARAPRAVSIAVASPLARRAQQAFDEAWTALGGEKRPGFEFSGPRPPRDLRARLGSPAPDVAFLSMNAEQARVLRVGFAADTAVWSTSLASVGSTSRLSLPELDGLRLVEMPWQLEPDSPAVMSYPKPPSSFNVEMHRLYALGIDAFRIGRHLLAGDTVFELDGVTGRLRFDRVASPRVERIALPAEYRNGMPRRLGAP
jgi:outer membrane PBP1 activator LpoA protein